MFLKKLGHLILSLLTLSFLMNCKSNEQLRTQIINPVYTSYSIHDERGYRASFSVDNEVEIPIGIIINKIEMPIYPSNKVGNVYTVNVLVTSRLLGGYQAKGADKPNGIIFEFDGKKSFRPVNFVRQ